MRCPFHVNQRSSRRCRISLRSVAEKQPRISIDLHLRDAASVFAREKQDTCAGPQRESFRRRLLQLVEEYDRLAQSDAPEFEVGAEDRLPPRSER
jgi:hypothetical protein